MIHTLYIENLQNKEIPCEETKNVLQNLQFAHQDWLQACGGKGRCTTCAMYVCEGAENLSPLTDFEQQQQKIKRILPEERLACQCFIYGEVRVKVPERLKLPHLKYD